MLNEGITVLKSLFPSNGITGIGILDAPQKAKSAKSFTGNQKRKKSIKSLAEAIILQSMADLWNPAHRDESLRFFEGKGYQLCADIAGLNWTEKLKMRRMLKSAGFEITPLAR